MSETFRHRVERLEHEPTLPSPEKHKAIAEHAEKIQQEEQAHAESLVEAREKVAELAKVEHEQLAKEQLEAHEDQPENRATIINNELKSVTFHRELKSIQNKLNPSERILSKAIHQPVIRVVSEAAGKTISRPSGLLGGGIMAFIGTSLYLFIAKHYGFEYNNTVFLVMFSAGFLLGLVLELVIHITGSSRKAHD